MHSHNPRRLWIDGFTSVKPKYLYHRGLLSQNWTSGVEIVSTEWFLVTNGLKLSFVFLRGRGIKITSRIELELYSPCPPPKHYSINYATTSSPLSFTHTHICTHKTCYEDTSRRHWPPVVIISICGDDKVTLGFVSTEWGRGGIPLRLKKASVSAGTIVRNYHMNMTTAPRPLKTINLPTPSAATPDNPLDIPS